MKNLMSVIIVVAIIFSKKVLSAVNIENDKSQKGIQETSPQKGFRLSNEAEKNFEIEKILVSSEGTVRVKKSSLVRTTNEITIFRCRDGFYKRIPFVEISNLDDAVFVKSSELKTGDLVVDKGVGFLRVTELSNDEN